VRGGGLGTEGGGGGIGTRDSTGVGHRVLHGGGTGELKKLSGMGMN